MSEFEIKEVERFKAIDEDGKTYTIIITQKFIISRTHDGTSRIPSLKDAETSDGRPLNRIDDDTFDLVGYGKHLSRI